MIAFPIPKAGPVEQQTLPVRDAAILALLLTAIAGFLDAIGYAQLHHLFVSFMSGNSTHLGMSLALHDWAAVKVL